MDNSTDNINQEHKRRVRYNGTHPKTFSEKYKELEPEKYAEDVLKVMSRGSTPAGMHRSICVKEILEILQIKSGEIGLDATLGYGGHTKEMLKCLDFKGCLYAIDVDSLELPRTRERLANLGYGEDILKIRQMNFSQIDEIAKEAGKFDFVLADLGVSSMQIDNPERGFSFKKEGPLDLRLDPQKGISAAQRLMDISQEELSGMFVENADEPYADVISKAIISEIRKGNKIEKTTELKDIIKEALKFLPAKTRDNDVKKSCQRCFQALRIDVNSEFEVLYDFLAKLPDVLAKNGRVAILSFHSGEDRLVKKSFKQFFNEGIYSEIANSPIRPSFEECNQNSRASCAKLRWAIKG